jgi:hypothetical protein
MTPAIVGVSRDGRYLVHNFGNGSGQVYHLRAFALPSGRSVDVSRFKQRVLTFAHAKRACRARSSQISYLVEGWLSKDKVRIGTEDWTRRPGCDYLYRKWIFKLS